MSMWSPVNLNLWNELGEDVVGAIHADIDALHANLDKASKDAAKRDDAAPVVIHPTNGQLRTIFQRHLTAAVGVRTFDKAIEDAIAQMMTAEKVEVPA